MDTAPTPFDTDMPIDTVSNRYKFISTKEILNALPQGFRVEKTTYTNTRNKSMRPFAPHSVTVRNSEWKQVDDVVPQMLIINSHNKQKPFSLNMGLYRLVCSNGLVVGQTIESYKQKHIGHFDIKEILQSVEDFSHRMPELIHTVERMKNTLLDDKSIVEFAVNAIRLRYPEQDVNPRLNVSNVLQTRRLDDIGNDVWRVYNTVQENLTRGGIVNVNGRRISEVRNINANTRINKQLWDMAVDLTN